jgi:predicted RNase H-like HicB family nuclease
MKTKFAIIVEWGPNNYSAYAPDLPGCITTGKTVEETVSNMREAVQYHIEFMHETGDPIPPSTSLCEYVEVEVPEPAVSEPQPR